MNTTPYHIGAIVFAVLFVIFHSHEVLYDDLMLGFSIGLNICGAFGPVVIKGVNK